MASPQGLLQVQLLGFCVVGRLVLWREQSVAAFMVLSLVNLLANH